MILQTARRRNASRGTFNVADLSVKIVKTFSISNDDLYFPLGRLGEVGVEAGLGAVLRPGLDVDVRPGVLTNQRRLFRIIDKP